MTHEEAIKKLESIKADTDSYGKKCINKAIEALEKQIPKKPQRISEVDDNDNAVVVCGCGASQDVSVKTIKTVHCWRCGQHLDWSDVE